VPARARRCDGPVTEDLRSIATIFDRAGRLSVDEIVALDRIFRATPGIGRAWSWAYAGQIRHANNYDYQTHWDAIDGSKDAMDQGRAAVWSAALRHSVLGSDDSRRAELDRIWTDVRWNATPGRWSDAATELLAVPGPTWGAALAVEAFVLAVWVGVLDPDRALIRPWEIVIEALPDWVTGPDFWPWTWPPP
jgi:hypothetical protein